MVKTEGRLPPDVIMVRGARLHNLKNISLEIPKGKLVVLSGVSGSGKSTLGFDILFKESLRQYMESIGMVTFGLSKPPVDFISGLSPAISVDQNLTNRSPRSTVGTSTEVYTYLRILFARLGHRPCPRCGKDVPPFYDPSTASWEGESEADEHGLDEWYPCPHCGARISVLSMAHFSFNKPEGACPTCTGLGTLQQVDIHRLVDEQKSLQEGAVAGWLAPMIAFHSATLKAAAEYYGLEFDPDLAVKDFNPALRDLLYNGVESPRFRSHFPNTEPPKTVRQGRFEGIATNLLRRYAGHLSEHQHDEGYRDKLEEFLRTDRCPDCEGSRLKSESREVRVLGKGIVELSGLTLEALREWLDRLLSAHSQNYESDRMRFKEYEIQMGAAALTLEEKSIAAPLLADLQERIRRLVQVGAGYLTIERPSPSISAGEAQRLRLAALLGSSLSGLLYILDEPTIGLHSRDTRRLIEVLKQLRDLGNTVLVIEHDLEVIAAADYVIDFGPGAGRHGGEVVAAGTPELIAENPASVTGAISCSKKPDPPSAAQGRSPRGIGSGSRGAASQPQGHHRPAAAEHAAGGDRRLWLGQVFADFRCARTRSASKEERLEQSCEV